MGKTDRQTDRSTWWSITTFAQDEIDRLKDPDTYPQFVKTIYGGLEECPDTKRIHFQGAIQCKSQQRFSAIKAFLPTTHIEAANSEFAIKKYAMKPDTAIEEKEERSNPRKFLSMADALTIIGKYSVDIDVMQFQITNNCKDYKEALKEIYWNAVRRHLREDKYDDISLFSQPQMISAWCHTSTVWIERAIVLPGPHRESDKLSIDENLNDTPEYEDKKGSSQGQESGRTEIVQNP